MAMRLTQTTGLRSRLAQRVLLLVLAAGALPVLLAGILTYRQLHAQAIDKSQAELQMSARFLGLGLLADLQRAASELAAQPQMKHEDEAESEPVIAASMRGMIRSLELRPLPSETGQLSPEVTLNALQRRMLAQRQPVLVISPVSGDPRRATLAIALLDAAGDHVALARVDTALLAEQSDTMARDARVIISDHLGRTFWSSVPEALEPVGQAAPGHVRWEVAGRTYESARWDLFLGSAFGAEPIVVRVVREVPSLLRDAGALQVMFPLVFVAALLFSGIVTLRVVRRYIDPLHQLSEATRAVAEQKFDVAVNIAGDDELSQLGQAFNGMARGLRQQLGSLQALSQVDRMLLESTDLEDVLGPLLPCVADVVGCNAVSVVLRDDDIDEHARTFAYHSALRRGLPVRRIELDWLAVERAIGRRRMCRESELPAEVREHLAPLELVPGSRMQIWSLRSETRLAGLLCVEFAAADLEALPQAAHVSDFADRIAVAVRNMHFTRHLYQKGHYDGLTGLPNRVHFLERLEAAVRIGRDRGTGGALLYLDLDSFKQINDTSGHSAGDALLADVAKRMQACLAPEEVIARLGGDEFAVLLPVIDGADHARRVAERLLDALASVTRGLAAAPGSGPARAVSASIGICLFPQDGESASDLLKHSDVAMYRAKESRRDHIVFFAAEMQQRMEHRAALEYGLRNAVSTGELALYYQPIYAAEHIVGGEALLRWFTASGEQISPATFIPIAEDSGLIHEVGRWALEEACRHRAAWIAQGVAPQYISVNVAPEQLQDPQFVNVVRSTLRSHRLDPTGIQLEITESALADGALVDQSLEALVGVGVRIALDDFGTGYSSLGVLQRLPIDTIKIDRAFIMHVPRNVNAVRLLEAILQMGRGLGKTLIAEGVEHEEQEAFLNERGCTLIQGFLRGRPMPASEFGRLLAAQAARDAARVADALTG